MGSNRVNHYVFKLISANLQHKHCLHPGTFHSHSAKLRNYVHSNDNIDATHQPINCRSTFDVPLPSIECSCMHLTFPYLCKFCPNHGFGMPSVHWCRQWPTSYINSNNWYPWISWCCAGTFESPAAALIPPSSDATFPPSEFMCTKGRYMPLSATTVKIDWSSLVSYTISLIWTISNKVPSPICKTTPCLSLNAICPYSHRQCFLLWHLNHPCLP